MKNPRKFYIRLFIIFAIISSSVGYYNVFVRKSHDENSFSYYVTFFKMLHQVKDGYVNEEKVSNQKLIYGALKGMMTSLDEFSDFYEPSINEQITIETEGKYGGLGIYLNKAEEGLVIKHVIEDTPAERCGLVKGDIIVKVDEQEVKELKYKEALALLKGTEGSEVLLSVFRPDEEKTIEVKSIREIIKVPSITNIKMLDDKLGYLRITQFNRPAAGQFYKALNTLLKDKNAEGLIIDLRNNPGGLLHSAVSICSNFIKEGELLVFTEGRKNAIKEEYHSLSGKKFNKLPIILLVNRHSASASEIMAACLKDYKVAISLGETTYGKGSVQSFLKLPDGSSAKYTSAYYFTPGKHLIHGNGVPPDYSVNLTIKEQKKFYKDFTNFSTDLSNDIVLQNAHELFNNYLAENNQYNFDDFLKFAENFDDKTEESVNEPSH